MNDAPAPKIAGHGLPSRFVSNFNITFGPDTSRIALGEVMGPGPEDVFWFDAFTIPTSQLVDMAQGIVQAAARAKAANQLHAPNAAEMAKFSRGGKAN